VLPEFERPDVADTPSFWENLEGQLRDQTERIRRGLDAPVTPDFERALGGQLRSTASQRARLEPFPVMAVAAALMLIVLTAGLLALLPARPSPTTAATPGTTATTATTDAFAEGSAEAMVVASFQRWVDGRTDAERLETRYAQAGYDVTIDRRPVTNASLNGQVLGVRHVASATPTTIGSAAVRGTVIVVVGQAYHVGDNISS
jgi:hypothetical protein